MNETKDMNEREDEPNGLLEQEQNADSAAQTPDDLEQACAEVAEWRDKYVRKLAEFDNYRKRMRAELETVRESVAESVLLSLLTVYDDMNRMLEAPANGEESARRGMELIQQKFKTLLEARGITKFECRGKEFNPEEHDAVMLRPQAGFPAGVILEEVTPGYRLGERVIRHAQVIVSSEASAPSESDTGDTQE